MDRCGTVELQTVWLVPARSSYFSDPMSIYRRPYSLPWIAIVHVVGIYHYIPHSIIRLTYVQTGGFIDDRSASKRYRIVIIIIIVLLRYYNGTVVGREGVKKKYNRFENTLQRCIMFSRSRKRDRWRHNNIQYLYHFQSRIFPIESWSFYNNVLSSYTLPFGYL